MGHMVPSEREPHQQPASSDRRISGQTRFYFYNCLPAISFLFLTVNADERSRHDPSEVVFIALCYSHLLLMLFLCLRSFGRLGPDSLPDKKEGLKAAAWVLTTALNFVFSLRVANLMPPVLAVSVSLMAGSIAVGGFYLLFIYSDADNNVGQGQAYSVAENKELSPEEKV